MTRGVKIPSFKKMSLNSELKKYLKPKYVYIPLVCQNDTNITTLVKKGDYVYKGDIVAKSKGHFRIPIHSSISGNVVDIVEKYHSNGHMVKCLMIENDFKEATNIEKVNRKQINKFTKEEFINKLRETGIVGMGGSGFPTYVKYETDKEIKTLIINAVECEPYITADYTIIKHKCEEILEAIDAIMEINGIQEAIIAIKNNNSEIKNIFNNYLGTYLKMRLVEVPNLYPMGWEKTLIKTVLGVNYKKLPIEKGIIVNNVSTIYAIYEALKFDKPLIERIVTFSGDMLKNPLNVLIKIGTLSSDVISANSGYKRFKDIRIIAGGPMMGTAIRSDELVISSNLNSVLSLRDTVEESAIECMRCGKCVEVCPAKISPVLIKDSLKNVDNLKTLNPNSCVECGLCSYICPSKINVRTCVIRAKKVLKEGEK